MKKRASRKAAHSSVSKSYRRVGKKHWYSVTPFKFSIVSVTILGCLALVIGNLYNLLPQSQNDVLGITSKSTKKVATSSANLVFYVKFVPTGSNFTIDTSKFDVGVKFYYYNDSQFKNIHGSPLIGFLRPFTFNKVLIAGSTIELKLFTQIKGFINYRNDAQLFNEKPATDRYIITPALYKYWNGSPLCTQSKPCIFQVKVNPVTVTDKTKPKPTPTPPQSNGGSSPYYPQCANHKGIYIKSTGQADVYNQAGQPFHQADETRCPYDPNSSHTYTIYHCADNTYTCVRASGGGGSTSKLY